MVVTDTFGYDEPVGFQANSKKLHHNSTMAHSVWTAQHAASLKALRMAAGLELPVLAKRHNLSVNQVRQLEEGGDSAFYTEQIKWAVGRKLTLALGGEFVEHAPDIETPTVDSPAPASLNAALSEAKPMRVAETTVAKPYDPDGATADPSATSGRKGGTGVRGGGTGPWVMSLGAGVVLALGLVWMTQEKEAPAAPTVAQEAPPTLPSAQDTPTAAAPAPDNAVDAQPPADMPKVTPMTPVAVTATPLVATDAVDASAAADVCRWTLRATDLTPGSGNRPDHYVHVVAQEKTTVCWRDADKKTRQQALQAGEKVSFWGTPPFQVYAANPATLKVYFKGQVVRWSESTHTQHIMLGARAPTTD